MAVLVVVKPATAVAWHQRLSRGYWRWRWRKSGRPPIPNEHVALIRQISTDHAGWGEDAIGEEAAVELGVQETNSTDRGCCEGRLMTDGKMVTVQGWRCASDGGHANWVA
jgi:hypothetical protein